MGNNSAYRFEVREGVSGTNRDEWDVVATFDTGAQAAAHKETYTPPPGHVLAVVRVTADPESDGDANWRERELGRFESGRYRRVPWDVGEYAPENWAYRGDKPIHVGPFTYHYPDHFAHIAESDATKVAFTENDAKGRKDIQKVMGASEYLQQFYYKSSCGDEGCCTAMPRSVMRECISTMVGDASSVLFADTGDEMQRIYEECHKTPDMGSCMTYDAGSFETRGVHPVLAYAAGDLSVAYMRADGDEGAIVARALVWPEKHQCGRIYGPSSGALKKALRNLGYVRPGEDYDALRGARLLKLPIGDYTNRFVMPYIDGSDGHRVDDVGAFWTINPDGDFNCEMTNGRMQAEPLATCDHCSDRIGRDDSEYTVDDENWCESCYSNDAYRCDDCGESSESSTVSAHRNGWRRDESIEVCGVCLSANYHELETGSRAGETWRLSDLVTCEHCGTVRHPDDVTDGADCCEGAKVAREEREAAIVAGCPLGYPETLENESFVYRHNLQRWASGGGEFVSYMGQRYRYATQTGKWAWVAPTIETAIESASYVPFLSNVAEPSFVAPEHRALLVPTAPQETEVAQGNRFAPRTLNNNFVINEVGYWSFTDLRKHVTDYRGARYVYNPMSDAGDWDRQDTFDPALDRERGIGEIRPNNERRIPGASRLIAA